MGIARYLSALTLLGALLTTALGGVVMVGWYAHLIPLIQVHPNWVPMQFNTALGFAQLGLALFSIHFRYSTLTKVLAIVVVILGGLTLSQYLTGLSLGIDQLFMEHYITTRTISPGRMAPNSALCFLLSGIGLLMLVQRRFDRGLPGAAIVGALITGLGTVALLGYISQVEAAYGWGRWTRMAIHTAIGFIVVGLTIVLQAQRLQVNRNYRPPAFMWSWVVGITGTTVTVAFWQALFSDPVFRLGTLDRDRALLAKTLLDRALNDRIDYLGWVPFGVLVLGLASSLTLSITVWFVGQFKAQILALQAAQVKILELNEQLEQISYTDSLTGIANRRRFDLVAERELSHARLHQTYLAFIVLDIDYFKIYNDCHGHLRGDEYLRQVAQVIQSSCCRSTSLVARYGGEEFIILLPDADLATGQEIAERILADLKRLRLPHPQSPVSRWITLSAGVTATIPDEETTVDALFTHADQALYHAKAQGRARVVAQAFTIATRFAREQPTHP